MRPRLWLIPVAVLFPLILARGYVWPLHRIPTDPGLGDVGHFVWNFWWMTERVLALQNPFQTSDLYYPLGARLTSHSYCFGFAPIGLAAKALLRGDPCYPIYAYRAAQFLSLSLGIVSAFAAFAALGARALAGAICAIGWTFSSFFAAHILHLNLLSLAFLVPLVTLAAVRLLQAPSGWRLGRLGAVLALGVYFSELTAIVALALALAAAAGLCSPAGRVALRRTLLAVRWRGLLIAALACLAIAAPFLANWLGDDAKPPKAKAAWTWRARPASWVVPDPAQTPLYRLDQPLSSAERWRFVGYGEERSVFFGYPALLLGLAGAFAVRRDWRAPLCAVCGSFLVLSLGPVLQAGIDLPLPYAALRMIPPFNMLRTPTRLVVPALWVTWILAALGLSAMQSRLEARGRPRTATLLAGVVLLWVAAESFRSGPPLCTFRPPAALAELAPGPVVNLPLGVMDGRAMLLQTLHHRPILSGYVSRRSPAQVAQVQRLSESLQRGAPRFAQALEAAGTSNVIIEPGVPTWQVRRLRKVGRLTVIDLRDVMP